jgi:hypothetical protein
VAAAAIVVLAIASIQRVTTVAPVVLKDRL